MKEANVTAQIFSSAMVAAIGIGEVFCKGRDFSAWLAGTE
jgi:hypothetical protein